MTTVRRRGHHTARPAAHVRRPPIATVVSRAMASARTERRGERRAAVVGGAGVALIAAAIASDFVIGSFWAKHAMLTSVVASLLIVVISVAVINELIERRDRQRWSLLAQSALFALV